MTTRISCIRAVLLGCLLALAAAGSASAGSLTLEGGTWVYRAAPGESNAFHVRPDDEGDGFYFHDEEIAIAVAPGLCRPPLAWDDETVARCPYGSGLRVELNDGEDRAYVGDQLPGGQQLAVDGGPGADRLSGPLTGVGVTFTGGEGNDELDGGHLDDVLDGGPGNDKVYGDSGRDVVRGGEGDDEVTGDGLQVGADAIDGGPGYDISKSDWIQRDTAGMIAISLDGAANDGHPGEGDNVVGVEDFTFNQPATFAAGADAVRLVILNHGAASSNVVGGPAGDSLRTYDFADTIDGAGGNDTIEAGHGDDTITGGSGRDTINAGAGSGSCNFLVCRLGTGNDTVLVRDGEQDSVVCGDGSDRVVADAIDTIAADCENVERSGGLPRRDEAPHRSDPRGPASGRRCVVPKVRAGAKLALVKRALTRRGCKAKVKLIRSRSVRRGRTVKLSAKAGKKHAYRKTITVFVSKGR
jgi:hypothetical protein